MKKVLIVTYYWPPSGGAGVQRWLKLSKYLNQAGVEVHVLTVHERDASYMQIDHSLEKDVAEGVQVYKTKSFEPINYYAKLVGKEKVPTAGFSNVDNSSWRQKLVNSLRSNLFIPDPRKHWKRYALPKAVEIIQREGIRTVITTSPPHSTQLIGLSLKKKLGVRWIVDLRDPWTDIYYYELLGHTQWSAKVDGRLEKAVLNGADVITTVSSGVKELFMAKAPNRAPASIHVIPNGYDPEDFESNVKEKRDDRFLIRYTGTMSDQYDPEAFFLALDQFRKNRPEARFLFQVIGKISEKIRASIERKELPFEFIPAVPHDEIVKIQQEADLLLLVLPNIKKSKGILTGKIFEYLASGNAILAVAPPDSDIVPIIQECEAGCIFDRDQVSDMSLFLAEKYDQFLQGKHRSSNMKMVNQYSRAEQALTFKALIQ